MISSGVRSITRKWGDHVMTYFTEGVVLLGTILVYKLAADRFGDEGFNIYAVVRRTTAFILPLAMMGSAVAVVRSVAMSTDEGERWAMVRSIGLVILGLAVSILILFLIIPAHLGFLIFGDPALKAYALPIGAMVMGQMMHALLYSYWRGSQKMTIANVAQFVNLGVVPVAAFLIAATLEGVLQLTAMLWIAFSVIPFLFLLVRNRGRSRGFKGLKSLLAYGLPRVPGDLALAGLFSLPVYLVNHTEGVEAGGQVAFGLTLLNIVGALFAPISLLMLPSISHALARKDHHAIIKEVLNTRNYTVLIALIIVLVFQLVAAPVLDWYVGGAPEGLVTTARILFSGALFFAVFISLRSLLDAYFVSAKNSVNILVSLGVLTLGALIYLFIWQELVFLLCVVPASLLCLAILTWKRVHGVIHELKSDMARSIAGDHAQR